ncbi:hypothetical protein [Nocardia paucivorans]|nr:hypothetical protein [Nocardia paucivorans]
MTREEALVVADAGDPLLGDVASGTYNSIVVDNQFIMRVREFDVEDV